MSNLLEQASLVLIPSGYKEDVVYSEIPLDGSGDLQFTRSSNGTRINSAGLVEVCPWNLLQQSGVFNVSPWAFVGGTTLTNGFSDVNGTLNAFRFQATSGSYKYGYQTISSTIGQVYTHSIYAKCSSGTQQLKLTDAQQGGGSLQTVTTEWQRFTFTLTASGGNIAIELGSDGTNALDIYICFAQTNIGSTAKPYFPTTDRLNVPRLTYQNGGGGCPSLLLEPQRTNLCTYSQDFSNAAWDTSNVDSGCSLTITPNYTTASNGLPAARLVASRTSTSTIAALVNYSPNTGTTATKSIWMKNNNAGNVTIMFGDEAVTITDSWERYSVTNNYLYSIIGLRYSGVALSCDISITGSQFEVGSYPTSYIPTTSSSATRVADACSKTGISSLIGQTEGVIYIDFIASAKNQDGASYSYITNFGTSNDNMQLYTTGDTLKWYARITAGQLFDQTANETLVAGQRYKIAYAYKSGDWALYINGVQKRTNTSANIPATSQFNFNTDAFGVASAKVENKFSQVLLFQTRLTNSQLAELTTI
jgi:hypothetical protein